MITCYPDRLEKRRLFCTRINAYRCSLPQAKWNSQSRVVHATAAKADGPYSFSDVALPAEAHNPHILRWRGEYLLFHIGDASRKLPVQNCTISSHSTTNRHVGDAATRAATLGARTTPATALVHRSSSLAGPWTPANTTLPGPCSTTTILGCFVKPPPRLE